MTCTWYDFSPRQDGEAGVATHSSNTSTAEDQPPAQASSSPPPHERSVQNCLVSNTCPQTISSLSTHCTTSPTNLTQALQSPVNRRLMVHCNHDPPCGRHQPRPAMVSTETVTGSPTLVCPLSSEGDSEDPPAWDPQEDEDRSDPSNTICVKYLPFPRSHHPLERHKDPLFRRNHHLPPIENCRLGYCDAPS